MTFWKKLARLFQPPPQTSFLELTVRCNRCGELLHGKVNLYNDLSVEYGAGGGATHLCRKVLIGQERCFQPVEVRLVFDARRRLVNREAAGGAFMEDGA